MMSAVGVGEGVVLWRRIGVDGGGGGTADNIHGNAGVGRVTEFVSRPLNKI